MTHEGNDIQLVLSREDHVTRPSTCKGAAGRRSRWLQEHNTVIEGKDEVRPSKFEAALESLESLGREGGRWEAVPQPVPMIGNQGKTKRASGEFFNRKKTTCMLYLQADHLFYEKMGRSEEACIEVMTRHVQSVNNIYRNIGESSQKSKIRIFCKPR